MSPAQSEITWRQDRSLESAPEGHAVRIRRISFADVKDALAKGVDDFRAMPRHYLFIPVIYGIVCLLVLAVTFNYSLLALLFPMVAGFALLGPFAAIGFYELSRRREQGLDTSWWHMFGAVRSASRLRILTLGLLLMAVFLSWLVTALGIFRVTYGDVPLEPAAFFDQLFTTGHGWALILLGNGVGALFALAVLTLTVVSFPMLVDRDVTLGTALETSFSAVTTNPRPMLAWGLVVVVLLIVGSIPFFVGLAVVLPVLGHATWHLYRKLVEN